MGYGLALSAQLATTRRKKDTPSMHTTATPNLEYLLRGRRAAAEAPMMRMACR